MSRPNTLERNVRGALPRGQAGFDYIPRSQEPRGLTPRGTPLRMTLVRWMGGGVPRIGAGHAMPLRRE